MGDYGKNCNFGEPISHKERQVLQLASDGRSYKEQAVEMGINTKTVYTHWANIRVKLGARTSPHALAVALVQRMIIPPRIPTADPFIARRIHRDRRRSEQRAEATG